MSWVQTLAVVFHVLLAASIIGLVLLFAGLLARGRASESLQLAASSLLRYLPLLLVPPAVGVMAYTEEILADFWAIVGVLVISLLVSLVFTGWLMQLLIGRKQRRQERA
jgi:putative effector of murein hydrolase LrgA (UPF0299 family)